MDSPQPVDDLAFFRAIWLLGAINGAAEQSARETEQRMPKPVQSPYQGHDGQRPGESFTAYRIRMRKEQEATS